MPGVVKRSLDSGPALSSSMMSALVPKTSQKMPLEPAARPTAPGVGRSGLRHGHLGRAGLSEALAREAARLDPPTALRLAHAERMDRDAARRSR
jgi:hypothetical protein